MYMTLLKTLQWLFISQSKAKPYRGTQSTTRSGPSYLPDITYDFYSKCPLFSCHIGQTITVMSQDLYTSCFLCFLPAIYMIHPLTYFRSLINISLLIWPYLYKIVFPSSALSVPITLLNFISRH